MSGIPRRNTEMSGASSSSSLTSTSTTGATAGTTVSATSSKIPMAPRQKSSLSSADTTASFKIGDRVSVGGSTKTGRVAFVGETKFAPGQWVGVSLDEPLGKNDGSVSGVSYFKCAPLHGVFSKAERLTKLSGPERRTSVERTPRKPSAVQDTARFTSSKIPTLSPAGSSHALNRTPSPTGSMTSVASSVVAGPLKVGDRVIVSSQTAGTKTGTLRYVGPTEFAAGEWAGVELDAALGKNDGSVGEKRYFECKPKFGLFAPLHKVTKSPSNKMRKLSVTGTTPGRLCRQRSDLSDASTCASAASRTPIKKISSITAPERMRAAVKEKDAKIEQLMKERNLERQEIAKAASQTEQVEENLEQVRKEYMAYKAKSTRQITDLHDEVQSKTKEHQVLLDRLDDERKKVEDLQFRLEEAQLLAEDGNQQGAEAEVARDDIQAQMDSLTLELEAERTKRGDLDTKCSAMAEELAAAKKAVDERKEEFSGKLFEAEEKWTVANAEIESLRVELQTTQKSLAAETRQVEAFTESLKAQGDESAGKLATAEATLSQKEDIIIELNLKLESADKAKQDLQAALTDKTEEVKALSQAKQDLNSQLSKQSSDIIDQTEKIKLLQSKLDTALEEGQAESSAGAKLRDDLTRAEKLVASKAKEVDELRAQATSSESGLQQDLAKKTEEMATLNNKLTDMQAKLKQMSDSYDELKVSYNGVKESSTCAEKEVRDLKSLREDLMGEIGVLKVTNDNADAEVKRLSGSVSSKDVELETLRTDMAAVTAQLKSLKSVIATSEAEAQEKAEGTAREHKKTVADLEDKLQKAEAARQKADKAKEDKVKAMEEKVKAVTEASEAKAQELEAKVTKASAEATSLAQEKASLMESTSVSSKETAELLCQVKQLEGLKAQLEGDLSQTKRDLETSERLASQVDSLKSDLHAANKAKSEQEDLVASLRLEVTTGLESKTTLEKEKAALQASLDEMRSTSSDSSAQIDKMNKDYEQLSSELESLKSQLAESKAQFNKVTLEKQASDRAHEDSVKTREADYQQSMAQLKVEVKRTQEDLEEKEARRAEAAEISTRLETELAEQTKRAADLQASVSSKSHEVEAANASLETVQADLKTVLKEKSSLEDQLETLKKTHDDEMGDLVDVVNDLKTKEEELVSALDQLEQKEAALDKLKRDSKRKEEELSDEVDRLNRAAERSEETSSRKLEEANKQIEYLKETNSSLKVEYDLKAEKLKKEAETKSADHTEDLDRKDAEIDVLKQQLALTKQELEFAKEEVEKAEDKIDDLQTDLEVKEAGFNNSFKENEENHKEEVEVLITKVEEAKAEVSDLHANISKLKSEHDAKIDEMLATRKRDVNDLQDKLSEKERQILDLNAQIEQIQGSLVSSQSQLEEETKLAGARVDRISKENEELRAKKGEMESQLRAVTTDFESAQHQNEVLSIKIVEKEQHIKEVHQQVESMKVSIERQQREMAERHERASQDQASIEDLNTRLDGERTRSDEIQKYCGELETERDAMVAKLEDHDRVKDLLTVHEEREAMLLNNIEDLKQKHAFTLKEFESERAELNDVVQRSKILVDEKLEQFKTQQAKFETLQAENLQLNNYKRQVLQLEQDKRVLESTNSRAPSLAPADDENSLEGLQGQIDFLNSVIVDMQRKNDDLKSKYEALESAVGVFDGLGVDTSDMMLLNGVDKAKPPPRLFCDICDQFDIHDTEDCPTQAMPDIQEEEDVSGHTKMGAKRGVQREYCLTCEVFGHSTENCDESQTF